MWYNIKELKSSGNYGKYMNAYTNAEDAEKAAIKYKELTGLEFVVIRDNLCEVYRTKKEA